MLCLLVHVNDRSRARSFDPTLRITQDKVMRYDGRYFNLFGKNDNHGIEAI